MKASMIIDIVLLGCGLFQTDMFAKIGFLCGASLCVVAMYLNGRPF
jgi:hypothetical protein